MNKKLVLACAIAAFSSANLASALSESGDKSGFSVFGGAGYFSNYLLGKFGTSTDGLKSAGATEKDHTAVDSQEVKFGDKFANHMSGPVGELGVSYEVMEGVELGFGGYYGMLSGKLPSGKASAATKTDVALSIDTFGFKGFITGKYSITESISLVGQVAVGSGMSKSVAAEAITYAYGKDDKECFVIAKGDDKTKFGDFALTGSASVGAAWCSENGVYATLAYKMNYLNAKTPMAPAAADNAGGGYVNSSFVHGLGLVIGYAW